jgi:NitT/TauT family transport system permease protein
VRNSAVKSRRFWKIAFYVILVALWEFLFRLRLWPEFLFPSPLGVFRVLANGFSDRSYFLAIGISMKRIFLGYGFSLGLGILMGLVIGSVKILDEIVAPLLLGLRTLPSICWLPLGLLWFGLNERAILYVVVMGATFSIALATVDGVKNIPPIFMKAAATMGASGIKKYVNVILPAALPSIVTGMKLGWSFAWRSLMAGEMLFVSLGLGHLLMMGRELNDIRQVIAVMLLIVFIGMIVDRLLWGQLAWKALKASRLRE